MKIHIVGRTKVKKMASRNSWKEYPENKFGVITITDPDKDWVKFYPNKYRVSILPLKFDDYDPLKNTSYQCIDMIEMKVEQAIVIRKWLDKYSSQIDELIVNCEAGVCRSSAVAFAIQVCYYGEDEDTVLATEGFVPNMHVYNLCKKEFSNNE